jgi:hypothetical protein
VGLVGKTRTKFELVLVAALMVVGWLAPAASAADVLSCGQAVTASVTLAADVGPCLGDGLVVTADGVTVDLNGHTVKGGRGNPSTTADQVGVRLANVRNVTVRNGTVRDFYTGVLVQGGSGNTLTGLTVTENNLGTGATLNGNGIYLNGSNGNQVLYNTVTHNGPFAGIGGANGAMNNHIAYNDVTDNNIIATGGAFAPTQEDDGIGFDIGASFNTVDHNHVARNGEFGISFAGRGVAHGTAIANDVRDNGNSGVNAGGAGGHLISDNVIDHNGYEQFRVPGQDLFPEGDGGVAACGTCFGPGDLTTIQRNVITANNGKGIFFGFNGTQFQGGTGDFGTFPAQPYTAPRSNLAQQNVVQGNLGDGISVQCDFLYDANFNASCLPNPPPHQGLRILNNRTAGNGGAGAGRTAWDLHDENAGCDSNVWSGNTYQTANPPCTTNP